MADLGRQSVRNIGLFGLIREAEVDSSLIPEGGVTEVVNFHFDRKSAATTRPGITTIGATLSAGQSCIGLHNIQSGTAIAVFVSSGSATVFERQSSSWNAIGVGIGASELRFVDFANRTIFFGPAESSIKVYAGSNFDSNSGDPINPDDLWYTNGDTNAGYLRVQFGEAYKSRVYLAGDNNFEGFGSRLWFSSVISSSGNITWTPSTDFVDINPSDGENISALKRYSLELLVFKPNYTYRFRTSGVDPDPLIRVGTRSQESVIEGKRGLYFHHDTGFYRYSGGYPVEISRAISDIVDAIPFGQYDNIASWKDSDHIYWSLAGDVTVPGVKKSETFTNVVLRYTESSDVWTVYSYGFVIGRGGPFITGTTNSIMVGLNNGVVSQFNKGTTDDGEPIKYRMSTKWYEWEGIENQKFIRKMVAVAEKGMGMNVMYQVDVEDNNWITLSKDLRELVTIINNPTERFNRIRFRVAGVTKNESAVFMGLEIIEGTNEGLPLK